MLWENTFHSCILEQCCQSWSVLRKYIFLQKCAEMLSKLIVWPGRENCLFVRHKSSLKGSAQVPLSACSHFTGSEWLVCQWDPLHGICQHTQRAAAVDLRLRTDSGFFTASHGERVGFWGNCTLGRLWAQCYRGNHGEHWSLFAFMGSAHSETVQDRGSKSVHVRLTHAKDTFCVPLLCYLGIASASSKPYLTASTAVMPTLSSKVKQPFDF